MSFLRPLRSRVASFGAHPLRAGLRSALRAVALAGILATVSPTHASPFYPLAALALGLGAASLLLAGLQALLGRSPRPEGKLPRWLLRLRWVLAGGLLALALGPGLMAPLTVLGWYHPLLRGGLVALALLLFAADLAAGGPLVRRGLLGPFTPTWIFAAATALCLGHQLRPSSAGACQQLDGEVALRVLLPAETLDSLPGLSGALPWEIAWNPTPRLLAVSLKQAGEGYLPGTDIDKPRQRNGLALFSLEPFELLDAETFPARGSAARAEALIWSDETTLMLLLSGRNHPHELRAYRIGEGGLELRGVTAIDGKEPVDLVRIPGQDESLVAFIEGQLAVAPARDPAALRMLPAASHGGQVRAIAASPERGRLWLSQLGGGLSVVEPGPPLTARAWADGLPGSAALGWDRSAQRLLVAGFARGELFSLDPDSGAILAQAGSEPHSRKLMALPELGLVAVTGPATGMLSLHDSDDLTLLRRIPVGRRARALAWLPERERLVIGSSCGLLELDPKAALEGAQ